MRPSQKFNLHPSTHSAKDLETKTFDVICIGSGWAGRQLAAQVCKAGFTALVVEKELFGGDCPFWACVPSKVLLRSQDALDAANAVGGAKERILDAKVDANGVFARRDVITANKDDTQLLVPMTEATGATLVRGQAKLADVKNVQIAPFEGEPVEVEARLAVAICSGSEAVIPDGVKAADPWTPRDATSADYVPEKLIIMGAGAVGCEMATAYAGFGSKVTLISSSGSLLPSIDSEAGTIVRKSLEERGVVVKLATKVTKATRTDYGVEAVLSTGEKLSASELLVASGRKATLDFGLEKLGLSSHGTHIPVNESLCVKTFDGNDWLYAVGDVNGKAPFTHSASRIAGNAIIAKARGQTPSNITLTLGDRKAIPQVTFTSPIVASVGLTRKAAATKGIQVRQITAPAKTIGGILHSDTIADGWAQWLVDEEERLVGATIVGTDAADLIHASTVAIVGGMKLEQMVHAVPCFPTMSEVYLGLLEAAGY
ncbi:hypothetical protein M409DRAFT_15700 [Zasmidium cellare ATCC 36951]|uniref:FAD/NAD(P)-binding domain-containing protein n=1 Tax=Zasmidium cellare ATCC 36951 TaxID=1080233 RepID=A0A6A6D710_ZASCE|nr:uncharacterized protein M409DRAFT_15700 [Zasmidium cellare ATCC 36951]KAF2173416.1 hypothetical protein M409DRAFT_15700 [Zasmidium cellare ATCC 36951]